MLRYDMNDMVMYRLFMDPDINEWLRAMHTRATTSGSYHDNVGPYHIHIYQSPS